MKIVVIGGTGLIGSKVVAILSQKGHHALAAAPSTGVDTVTGQGLVEALTGADVVVDLANSPSFEEGPAMEFFQAAGHNITAAEIQAGVRHHVALSVVGTERLLESGYFRAKLAQERLIKASPIPYTLLRACQFFEFIRTIADISMVDGAVRLPHTLFQPMAAQDVAAAVAEAALAAPANGMREVGGPVPVHLDDMIAKVLAFDKDPRPVITDPQAPYYGIKVDDRSLMPGPDARLGATTIDWWLANVPPPKKK